MNAELHGFGEEASRAAALIRDALLTRLPSSLADDAVVTYTDSSICCPVKAAAKDNQPFVRLCSTNEDDFELGVKALAQIQKVMPFDIETLVLSGFHPASDLAN